MNKTKFCHKCGAKIDIEAEICPKCGVRQTQQKKEKKNKLIAAVLAFFLGWIGVHKFYLGQNGWGVVYFLFCWTWIPAIVGFIEGIYYLILSEEEFNKKYNQ